jgi:hypothetical protein
MASVESDHNWILYDGIDFGPNTPQSLVAFIKATPAQFDAHIRAETARYAKIVKEAGIKAE